MRWKLRSFVTAIYIIEMRSCSQCTISVICCLFLFFPPFFLAVCFVNVFYNRTFLDSTYMDGFKGSVRER